MGGVSAGECDEAPVRTGVLSHRATIEALSPDAINSVVITQTVTGVSKPQADMIAPASGARILWRNGCYMAARDFGRVQLEIHFAPLITCGESIGTDRILG